MNDNELFVNEMIRIKKDFLSSLNNYKKFLETLSLDAPIEVLCLPENIRKILIRNKIFRVSDIVGRDLGKIKGLGDKKIGIIEYRMSQFTLM